MTDEYVTGGNLNDRGRAAGLTEADVEGGQVKPEAEQRLRKAEFDKAQAEASVFNPYIAASDDPDLRQRADDAGLATYGSDEDLAKRVTTKELVHDGVQNPGAPRKEPGVNPDDASRVASEKVAAGESSLKDSGNADAKADDGEGAEGNPEGDFNVRTAKKPELVDEAKRLDIDSEGTADELRERIEAQRSK